MIRILAASLGILAVSRLPNLPEIPPLGWPVLWLAALALLYPRPTRLPACLLLGALWGLQWGQATLDQQLPPALEGEELLISGVVASLPETRADFQRFEFEVSAWHNLNPDYRREETLPERLLLSWYGETGIRAAQQWTFKVRLSRPRGFVNEGGFDYQRWLLSQSIGATGYVRPSGHNRLLGQASGYRLQQQRARIAAWIDRRVADPQAALLRALAIGDSSRIGPGQWQVLRNTGTNHLLAISGLHIGLLALFGYWLGQGLRALISLRWPAAVWIAWLPNLSSCLFAAGYSALAGFALPTQRALVMVLLLNLALFSGRQGAAVNALGWALLVVLILDPLAGYDLGFWLSFAAVAWLLFCFRERRNFGVMPGWRGRVLGFGRAQWVIFVGLALPLLLLNQSLSPLAPLANMLAIPLVSFAVVLPLLAGGLLQAVGLGAADWLLQLSAVGLEFVFALLSELDSRWPDSGWVPAAALASPWLWLAAGLGILMLLLPRGLPGRWLGLPLLLPLVWPAATVRPDLSLTVLDVGQGLAAVVRTREKVLVFDTGPVYSERFNAGAGILLPWLRRQGIGRIDRLIVSHGDGDHAGGSAALSSAVPVDHLTLGEVLPAPLAASRTDHCDRDRRWEWEGVHFELIEAGIDYQTANNRSCVLLVTWQNQEIFLPGDIEAPVEAELLAAGRLPADVSVLIAPHHGSASSSTEAFVKQTRPRHVVYSTDYRSPYGHPAASVQQRYAAAGSRAWIVGETGQLDFVWEADGSLRVEARRESAGRYWLARPEPEF